MSFAFRRGIRPIPIIMNENINSSLNDNISRIVPPINGAKLPNIVVNIWRVPIWEAVFFLLEFIVISRCIAGQNIAMWIPYVRAAKGNMILFIVMKFSVVM